MESSPTCKRANLLRSVIGFRRPVSRRSALLDDVREATELTPDQVGLPIVTLYEIIEPLYARRGCRPPFITQLQVGLSASNRLTEAALC